MFKLLVFPPTDTRSAGNAESSRILPIPAMNLQVHGLLFIDYLKVHLMKHHYFTTEVTGKNGKKAEFSVLQSQLQQVQQLLVLAILWWLAFHLEVCQELRLLSLILMLLSIWRGRHWHLQLLQCQVTEEGSLDNIVATALAWV